jgi:hypothetical protein
MFLPSSVGVVTPRTPSHAATVGLTRGCPQAASNHTGGGSRQRGSIGASELPPEVSAFFCLFLWQCNQSFQASYGSICHVNVSFFVEMYSVNPCSFPERFDSPRCIVCCCTASGATRVQYLEIRETRLYQLSD